MSVTTRSTSPAGRSLVGRPAVACSSLLMMLAVVAWPPARADAAANASVTIQLLWQVQQGCATRCAGVSQTQTAVQTATVLQVAASSQAGGVARNASAVIQLVVQSQLGCVAFCTRTTRVQSATQRADVTQLASAIAGALASNGATVSQLVWQYQDVCLEACDDVSATQVVDQAAATVQSAGAGAGPSVADGPPLPPELQSFLTWLASVAGSAVVDVVQAQDVAACLHDCDGDVQVQLSVQAAQVTQAAVDDAPAVVVAQGPEASATVAAATAATVPAAAPVAAAPRARSHEARRKARRPGHRGRRSAIGHRRPPIGGIHHVR